MLEQILGRELSRGVKNGITIGLILLLLVVLYVVYTKAVAPHVEGKGKKNNGGKHNTSVLAHDNDDKKSDKSKTRN